MYNYMIGQSANGNEIYINLISSSAGQYLSRRPYVLNLIKEVLATMSLKGSHIVLEHDMGRVIGKSDIVETSENDTIYYAQPNKIKVYSRFAKNRYSQPSNLLTIILDQDDDGNYIVSNTWIGPSSPPFPGDEKEETNSKIYWENHALVHDAQSIQTKTITKNCPY